MINTNQYLSFNGEAKRSEYWGVMLISWGLCLLVSMLGLSFMTIGSFGATIGGLLILAAIVLTTWAELAVTARRCRDAGINPWFALTLFVPYINIITIIVFGVIKSNQGK